MFSQDKKFIILLFFSILFDSCTSDREKAYNYKTTSAELHELLKNEDSEVRNAAIENNNVADEDLAEIAKHGDYDIKISLLKREFLPVQYLEFLSKDKNSKIREKIAHLQYGKNYMQSPGETMPDSMAATRFKKILLSLTADKDTAVLFSLLSNNQLPEEGIIAIAKSDIKNVNKVIAKMNGAPSEALNIISVTNDLEILSDLARNNNTPVSTLLKIVKEADKFAKQDSALCMQMKSNAKRSINYADPAEIDFFSALSKGLISVHINGSGLESVSVTIKNNADYRQKIKFSPGIIFNCSSGSSQSMVSRAHDEAILSTESSATFSLEASCIEMHKDVPDVHDHFTIRPSDKNSDLFRLVNTPGFDQLDFRIQQFAIWTITDNPSRDNYTGITNGYNFYGSGPSDEEFRQMRQLFKIAGVRTAKYNAFK